MKISVKILKSFLFRIISPIIVLTLLIGFGLFIFVKSLTTDFINSLVKENMKWISHEIFKTVDEGLEELLKKGLSGDEDAVRIKKSLTLSEIEELMKDNNIDGEITENGSLILSTSRFIFDNKELTRITAQENVVLEINYHGKIYYTYFFQFEPWGWRIILVKDSEVFSILMDKVKSAYAITGVILLLLTISFLYFMNKTIKYPLRMIINSLKQGEKPEYKGIYEFEFLSGNIGNIIESLHIETQRLNSIYHIVISKRGEDFFNEVTMAIGKMFDLNSFISNVNLSEENLYVISMYEEKKLVEGKKIPLKGTACEEVVAKKDVVIIESDAYKLFPLEQMLNEAKAESYAGIPVFNRTGEVIGIVGVFGKNKKFSDTDIKFLQTIGHMVSTEFELLDKTVYLENILRSSADTAIISTDINFNITSYNPASETIFKDISEEVIGKNLSYILVGEAELSGSLKNAVEIIKKESIYQFNFEISKNKKTHIIESRIYGIRNVHNNLTGFVMMARDITEHKHLEEQLLHSQKLDALGKFAGGIAHDFNNILTAVIGYSNLLSSNVKGNDHLMNYVDHILTSSQRAVNLVQNLLAFGRKQIIDPQPVNINDTVRKVEKLLMRLIGEDIEFRTILTDKNLTVITDSGQIEQVLMNLATNARDAMPRGGRLIIETGLFEISMGNIKEFPDMNPGIYAFISVTDSGTGMEEKIKEHIFEPFYTTKEVGKGTGLGLSIVYGIIKQHGGNIEVLSKHGKGTCFKIYLPVVGQDVEEAQIKAQPPAEKGTELILLAEDDEDVRTLVKEVLELHGYLVIQAVNGEDALNIYRENRRKIDMLLFDVIMPKMNGNEAYHQIKKIAPDIKVLFFSGYTADIMHLRGVIDKGIEFISKPVTPSELLSKVREILDRQ